MSRILAGRDALYANADARLDTNGKSVEESLDELLRLSQAVVGAPA